MFFRDASGTSSSLLAMFAGRQSKFLLNGFYSEKISPQRPPPRVRAFSRRLGCDFGGFDGLGAVYHAVLSCVCKGLPEFAGDDVFGGGVGA